MLPNFSDSLETDTFNVLSLLTPLALNLKLLVLNFFVSNYTRLTRYFKLFNLFFTGEPSRKKLTAKPKDTPQADSEEKESESKVPESATTSASVAVDSPSAPACSEKTGISSEKSGTTSEKPGISSEKSGTISDGEKPGTTSEEKKSGTTSDEGKASTTSDEGKSDKPSGVSTDKAGEDTDKTPSKSGSDKPIDDREVIVKASDTSGVDTSEVAGPSKQTDGESTGRCIDFCMILFNRGLIIPK